MSNKKERKTTHIRIYKDNKEKLKKESEKRKISIVDLIDEKLQKL